MGSLRLSPERSSERWEGGHPGLCRSKPREERSLGSLEPLPPFLPAVFDILRPTQGLSAKSIPKKQTPYPRISDINVLKCRRRKSIATTGNRKEFSQNKKQKTSTPPPTSQYEIYCNLEKRGEFQMSIIRGQAIQLPANYDLTSGGAIGERICMNLSSLVCIFATIV